MTKISSLSPEIRNKVLGAGDPDASCGVLYQSSVKAKVDPKVHTVFIGLGGQGIRTVNRIKQMVVNKFDNYQDHVAFLAVDTDWTDLKHQTVLSNNEKLLIGITRGINERYNYPQCRSMFTNSWIYPKFYTDLTLEGANQIRQAMRAKLFDQANADAPKDEEVLRAIGDALASVWDGYSDNQSMLDVHIFAGISGGTGGGGIVETAHFVRRAAPSDCKIGVYGYIMLPETSEHLAPNFGIRCQMHANGYATLKELDYYYSAGQRNRVFTDIFTTNSDLNGIKFSGEHPLFEELCLVGRGERRDISPNATAIETLASAMVIQIEAGGANKTYDYLLCSIRANEWLTRKAIYSKHFSSDGCESNLGEQDRFYGEDTFAYSSVGAATAGIPTHAVKMYTIAKSMRTLLNKENGFAPKAESLFKGFNRDACTPLIAKQAMGQLIAVDGAAVAKMIRRIAWQTMQWKDDLRLISRGEILAGDMTELNRQLPQDAFEEARERVTRWLDGLYEQYLSQLYSFLMEYGPMAYRDMWEGHDSYGEKYACNVQPLRTLIENYRGYKCRDIDPDQKANELNMCRKKVAKPIIELAATVNYRWHQAYLEMEQEKLAQKLANFVFGCAGEYAKLYLDKIQNMSERVVELSYVLEELYDVYNQMGETFATYERFRMATLRGDPTFVNIIEDAEEHSWVKKQIDEIGSSFNFWDLKENLIDSFLADPVNWTECDERDAGNNPRKMMDILFAPYVKYTDQINLAGYLNDQAMSGRDIHALFGKIISAMLQTAKPLYDGNWKETKWVRLTVPVSFYASNARIQQTIHDVIGTIEANSNTRISVFPCFNADNLTMVTYLFNLPLYSLHGLAEWQDAYDRSDRHMIHANESNKGIYNRETGLPWEDYPALVLSHNPELVGPDGRLSREGMFYRERLSPLFREALAQGVIVRDINRRGEISYHCNIVQALGDSDKFDFDWLDPSSYRVTDENGHYVKGDALFDKVSEIVPGACCHRLRIELRGQEEFTDRITDESLAEMRAKRVLRRNVPMYLAVKETLRLMGPVFKSIDDANVNRGTI